MTQNSPANTALAFMMPDVYRCPETPAGFDETSYVVVDGPGFLFDGNACHGFADIIDGPSDTVMVVDSAANRVHWMSPLDVPWDATGIDVGSIHGGELHALMADATVVVRDGLSEQELEAALTIGGREPISIAR